jgi:hypothetical protein
MIDLLSNSVPLDTGTTQAFDALEALLDGQAIINESGKVAYHFERISLFKCDWWFRSQYGEWDIWRNWPATQDWIRKWWVNMSYDKDVWLLAHPAVYLKRPGRLT